MFLFMRKETNYNEQGFIQPYRETTYKDRKFQHRYKNKSYKGQNFMVLYRKLEGSFHKGNREFRKKNYRSAIKYYDSLIGAPDYRLQIQEIAYIKKASALCMLGLRSRMKNVLAAFKSIYQNPRLLNEYFYCSRPKIKKLPRGYFRKPIVEKSVNRKRYDHDLYYYRVEESDTVQP